MYFWIEQTTHGAMARPRTRTRMGCVRRLALVATLVFTWWLPPSSTAVAMTTESAALYAQGKHALKRGDHATALEYFHVCLDQVKGHEEDTLQLILAVALTYEKMGAWPQAAEFYERFARRIEGRVAELGDKWQKRLKTVQSTLTTLNRRLIKTHGRLHVDSTPDEASLVVDGQPAGVGKEALTPFTLYLTPGKHVLRVEAEGYQPTEEVILLKTGEVRTISLTLTKQPVIPVVSPPAPPVGVPIIAPETLHEEMSVSPLPPSDNLMTQGVLMGVGGALVIAAAGLSGAAAHAQHQQQIFDVEQGESTWDALDISRENTQRASWVLYAAGGATLIAGLGWFLHEWINGSDAPPKHTGMPCFQPMITREGGLLSATWTR